MVVVVEVVVVVAAGDAVEWLIFRTISSHACVSKAMEASK